MLVKLCCFHLHKVQKSELCRGEDRVGKWSSWPKVVPSHITSHKTGILGDLVLSLKFDVT